MWEIESIPNMDQIFRRIHKNEMDPDDFSFIPPMNFHEIEGGISCDWEKYSNPEESRERAKNPSMIGIIGLNVGNIRQIELLEVTHNPSDLNRAHSNIIGLNLHEKAKRTKIRLKLAEKALWKINPFV
jgi:hypothetical protein